jgi:chromosome segregation ATPase
MEEILLILAEVGPVVAVALILSAALLQLARTLQPIVEALMKTVGKLGEHVDKTQQAIDRYAENEREQTTLMLQSERTTQTQLATQTETLLTALNPIITRLDSLREDVGQIQQALSAEQAYHSEVNQKLDTLNQSVNTTRTDILQALNDAVRIG